MMKANLYPTTDLVRTEMNKTDDESLLLYPNNPTVFLKLFHSIYLDLIMTS